MEQWFIEIQTPSIEASNTPLSIDFRPLQNIKAY